VTSSADSFAQIGINDKNLFIYSKVVKK